MSGCSAQHLDFVIIGSAKCGTTSLADWLGQHPDVCMSVPKETMFFGSEKLFSQGLQWFFQTCFSHCRAERLLGEATPAYSDRDRHPLTAARLASAFPNIKLIYIVRHPLRRVESAWRMLVNGDPNTTVNPVEKHAFICAKEGFRSFLSDPEIFENAVSTSCYYYQLHEWIRYFPSGSIHVMFLEDLVRHRDASLDALCRFLGISSEPMLSASLSPKNSVDQRRNIRPFVSLIVRSRIQRLVPPSLRSFALRTGFFSRPQKGSLPAIWPASIHSDFTQKVRPDIEKLLRHLDKPSDFYVFDDAALEP
jgi:hypothetical protein